MAILDSAYRGSHDTKITFIVRPFHYKLDFLHLHTLKIGLKIYVCVLEILDLAMPMHMSTFHQDFPQLNFCSYQVHIVQDNYYTCLMQNGPEWSYNILNPMHNSYNDMYVHTTVAVTFICSYSS